MTCIHLGLPKAASTTLQQHLFAKHSQIEYLGRGEYGPGSGKSTMEAILVRLPTCDDDATLDMWWRSVSEIVEPALQNGRVPVLSHEDLVVSNHAKLATNIERVFGPSKVILIVRHPLRWIEALYWERLRVNRFIRRQLTGIFTFEDFVTRHWDQDDRGFLKCLMSRKILEPYVARFGKQSVGVFMFEHLQSDPKGFMEVLCEFIGVEPVEGVLVAANEHSRKRITRGQVERLKVILGSPELTRLFRLGSRKYRRRMIGIRPNMPLAKVEPATVEIPDIWRSRIEDLVRDDCNYLRQEFGLPVDEAGYPL